MFQSRDIRKVNRKVVVVPHPILKSKGEKKKFEETQASADARIEAIRAQGASNAQKILTATLTDKYLQYLWIKNLENNRNVVYVATENNIPIFKNIK